MRYVSILFFFVPIWSIAQQVDSALSANSEKLSIWYRNSFQAINTKSSITTESKPKSLKSSLPTNMGELSPFLYTPYSGPNWRTGQPATIRNTPYYGGYLDPTGGANVGLVLLAGGINYIIHYNN